MTNQEVIKRIKTCGFPEYEIAREIGIVYTLLPVWKRDGELEKSDRKKRIIEAIESLEKK